MDHKRSRHPFYFDIPLLVILIVLLLLILLGGGLGDTVQITLAGLGDAAAALLLVVLDNANLLERLQDLAVDGARGVDVLAGAAAPVLGSAVDLAEAADADRLPEVDVAGDRGGAHVVPVNVLGRQLLGVAGLDGVDPAYFLLDAENTSMGLCTEGRGKGETYQEWAACPGASGKQHRR